MMAVLELMYFLSLLMYVIVILNVLFYVVLKNEISCAKFV